MKPLDKLNVFYMCIGVQIKPQFRIGGKMLANVFHALKCLCNTDEMDNTVLSLCIRLVYLRIYLGFSLRK